MNEYLFNILIENKIGFFTNEAKTIFIIVDYKLCISSIKLEENIKYKLRKNNYSTLEYLYGIIKGEELSNLLNLDYIKVFNNIII